MILPSVILLNSVVTLTFAEPPSSDSGQQLLPSQNAEMLLPPSLYSMIEKSDQTLNSPLVASYDTNEISTINDKTNVNMTSNEVLNEVADIIFNGIPQHEKVLELLLQDIQRGNHLLLVENRGSENNKSSDGVLQLLNRPTEHIQLHRDTTIQSLTLQPTVKDGIVFYDDSPLIKAVKYGHVLVVDEVDKAPTNVTCSLNILTETGEMELSDGRRIAPKEMYSTEDKSAYFIPAHKDFRIILKTSRTGFPFFKKTFSDNLGLGYSSVRSVSASLPQGNRSSRYRRATSEGIGTIVKAVGTSSKVTTAVMGGSGTGPHTATAVASGRAVAIATSITYGSGSSTSTAIASGTSTASASSYSYDRGVATTTAISAGSSSAIAEAIARGDERKTDTKIKA
ncbi:unnamed protein product [Parnassius apollo]|uniref:(apollo) hypothetical protein n=1 Tax=Parnassius apollo TaxID=110799 RepID=A0A8S3XWC2_PARAO|nr:unnamed protein product [Parnassius apollo]